MADSAGAVNGQPSKVCGSRNYYTFHFPLLLQLRCAALHSDRPRTYIYGNEVVFLFFLSSNIIGSDGMLTLGLDSFACDSYRACGRCLSLGPHLDATDDELIEAANGNAGQTLTPYHSLFRHLFSWEKPRK
jgi:hypothetical protein